MRSKLSAHYSHFIDNKYYTLINVLNNILFLTKFDNDPVYG